MQYPQGGYGPPPGIYQPLQGLPGQPPAGQPTQQDYDNLRMLGIGTFVYAGLVGLISLFCLIYVVVGLAMIADPGGDPNAEVAGGVIALVGVIVCSILLAKCILLVFSGIGLLKHKWRTASYIGAALCVMNMPLGTILGVFTFLVLGRPSVRALYEAQTVK